MEQKKIPTENSKSLELAKTFLGKEVEVTMDRSLGSKHPEHGFFYEVNYGYIKGVIAPDGDDLDAYFLGVNEPVEKGEGICIAIVHRKDDDDDKLVVVPKGVELTNEQIASLVSFQEKHFDTEIIR